MPLGEACPFALSPTDADEFKRAVEERTTPSGQLATGPTLAYWVEFSRLMVTAGARPVGPGSHGERIRAIVPPILVQKGKQASSSYQPVHVMVCSYYAFPKDYAPSAGVFAEPELRDGMWPSRQPAPHSV